MPPPVTDVVWCRREEMHIVFADRTVLVVPMIDCRVELTIDDDDVDYDDRGGGVREDGEDGTQHRRCRLPRRGCGRGRGERG